MNYTTKDNWHFVADNGYYFKKDDCITSNLYLGKFDSIENWTIITEEEKIAFEKELEEKTLEEQNELEQEESRQE